MKKICSLFGLILLAITLSGCMHDTKQEQMQPKEMESTEQAMPMIETPSMNNASYIDVTPAEAQELINTNPDLIIIDVSPNYANGHLPNSVSYYLGDGTLDEAIPNLDKSATYLVYCHLESASISGAQKLIDAGFEKVYRLEGDYKAWVDAGYPIEK